MRNQCLSSGVSVCVCVYMCVCTHSFWVVAVLWISIHAPRCAWRLSPTRTLFTPPLVSVTTSPKLQRWNGENSPPKHLRAAADWHRATSFFPPAWKLQKHSMSMQRSGRYTFLSLWREALGQSSLHPSRSKSVSDCRSPEFSTRMEGFRGFMFSILGSLNIIFQY